MTAARCWLILLLALLMTTASGCNLPGTGGETGLEDDVAVSVAATLTKEAFRQKVESARATEDAQPDPTETLTPTATSEPTQPPTATLTPTVTPTPEPVHVMIPGRPSSRSTFVTDLITVDLARDKTAIGDTYAWSRLERPYTAGTMEYLDFLDIMRVDMQVKEPWVYLTYLLIGDLPEEGDYRYAVELDTDHEGRGEILVMASLPPDEDWTTEGVLVMSDGDGDVGGFYPLYEDAPDPDQNGYETELFNSGRGEDPDLAWVRRDPEHTNRLQIAFKSGLLGPLGVLWSAWTDGGLKDPALFDINDHYTFEEAGSPNKDNYRYPVKAVSQMDSTCRSWYGFIPTGKEPGLCTTGESADDEPGLGYCVTELNALGCQGACLIECPQGEVCLPCQLP